MSPYPGFLQDPTGAGSSGRLVMVIINLLTIGTWAASTLMAAYKGTTPITIPAEIITLCLGSGLLKVGNSVMAEKKEACDASKQ